MSHSVCWVITDQNPTNKEEAESIAEEALVPFDENIEVDEYDAECHCIGNVARNEAASAANKAVGVDMEDLQNKYRDEIVPEIVRPFVEKYGKSLGEWPDDANQHLAELQDAAWKEATEPWQKAYDTAFESHPMKDKPDPTCGFYTGERQDWWPYEVQEGDRYEDESGCGGTGTYRSTYNPQSKWDWWQVGGRWNGYLDDYDPRSDERNFEVCRCCGGTGDRDGWVVYRRKEGLPMIKIMSPLLKSDQELEELLERLNHTVKVLSRQNFDFLLSLELIDRDDYERAFSGEWKVNSPSLLEKDREGKTEEQLIQEGIEWAKKMNGCNGCNGEGKSLKFPGNGHVYQSSNVMPVARLPISDEEVFKKYCPFAILTPDGQWHERGNMGWWGMVSDEKDDWPAQALEIVKDHVDKTVIVCDLHI